ncbi:hypothetical protein ZHAS_00005011 [Anopheles sinensis]|uniref:SECA_MOTOR_DEAD domain-containing protein n=1 Tax=Anopheles sinensis TaxID=74873 RepID=A0A084VIP6_ANOSI|nr:hypothetical protein ZHAS_00005011 [Anopheles sinensis]
MLYLSHDIPWMDKLEPVYLFIWQWINRPEEIAYNKLDEAIEEAVLSDMYGMLREKDIRKIDVRLSDHDCRAIWTKLVKAQILDERGRPIIETVDEPNLSEVLGVEFSKHEDRIRFLLQDTIGRERLIPVPNYLRAFVERHLRLWIKSAKTAFFMNPGHNYVVDVDRTGTCSDRNANVIILDRDTGTDQANSQWDEALHQFLQLKHGCRLSMLSLKAVFISNVSYFKLYRRLYGLTGTLGSQTELDLLREIHKVDFVTIPTAHTKQFHETPPIICCDKEAWTRSVCYQAQLVTTVEKRSVLIICETVKDVKTIYRAIIGQGKMNVHCYERDYEEFAVASGHKKLDQGQVIVATNLAGRGTDIKITDALRNAGGLHVCLTYLPDNKRIEEQAFGRAARSGDRGSGQLIIVYSKEDEKKEHLTKVIIWDMKKERDIEEALRVSEIKSYYNNQIIAEENCFKEFKDQYEQLKRNLNEDRIPNGLQEILLKSCLDRWAFWLDEHSDSIPSGKDGDNAKSYDQLSSTFKRLCNGISKNKAGFIEAGSLLPWVDGMPAQMNSSKNYGQRGNCLMLTVN